MPGRSYAVDEPPTTPDVRTWDDFGEIFYEAHSQGEHVAIVGPSGSGKTWLGIELCKIIGSKPGKDKRPSRVTVLQYKPRDDTVTQLIPDWPIIKKWPPAYGQEHCVVWPKATKASSMVTVQRAVFLPLLDEIYQEGGQSVYIPEAAYFERHRPHGLGAGGLMEQFWSSARSLKLTVISDTQRPRHVTRLMWSEPQWVFIFQLDDEDDLRRVAQLTGFKRECWAVVPNLGEHEFVCIRRQRHAGERAMYVSKVGS